MIFAVRKPDFGVWMPRTTGSTNPCPQVWGTNILHNPGGASCHPTASWKTNGSHQKGIGTKTEKKRPSFVAFRRTQSTEGAFSKNGF